MTEIIDVSPIAKRRQLAGHARVTAIVMGLLVGWAVYANLPTRVYELSLAGISTLAVVGTFVYLGSAAARGRRLAAGILATMLALFFVSVPLILILESSPPERDVGNANVLEDLVMLLFVLSILAYPQLALLTLSLGQRVKVTSPLGVTLDDGEFLRRKWRRFWWGTFNLWRLGLAVLVISVLVGLYNWIMSAPWWTGVIVGLVLAGILWVVDGILLNGSLYFLTLDYVTKRPEEILEKDRRPIVLYLRSFGDETVQIKRSFFGESAPFSFENLMVRALWETGPVVSVGDPMDMLPMFGSSRVYLADDEWQAHVADWIDQAQLIVVLVGKTAGLEWEYR